jgi:FkbM family methyltransferase
MFYLNDKVRRNVLVSSDHGMLIVNRFDHDENAIGISQFILDHGNTSTVEASHCIERIKHVKNPVIFDIGANIGTFTMWLANYFPNGKIYSFEPQRLVYQMLCGNLAINNIFNVYTHNMALGNTNSKISISEPDYNTRNNFGRYSLKTDNIISKSEKSIINQITVDNFVFENNISHLDLLKIDAEGMDVEILHGSIDTIKRDSPVIFVEYFDNQNNYFDEIVNFLNLHGYKYDLVHNNLLGYKT